MNEIKLKPCPFCGGAKPAFTSKTSFYDFQKRFNNADLTITCVSCDLYMGERSFYIRNYEVRMKLLAEKWNRRAEDEID